MRQRQKKNWRERASVCVCVGALKGAVMTTTTGKMGALTEDKPNKDPHGQSAFCLCSHKKNPGRYLN